MNLRELERVKRRQEILESKLHRQREFEVEQERIKQALEEELERQKQEEYEGKNRLKKQAEIQKKQEAERKRYYLEIDRVATQVRQTRLKQLGLVGLSMLLNERRELLKIAESVHCTFLLCSIMKKWKTSFLCRKVQDTALEVFREQEANNFHNHRLVSRAFNSFLLFREFSMHESVEIRKDVMYSCIQRALLSWKYLSVLSRSQQEKKIERTKSKWALKRTFGLWKQALTPLRKEKTTKIVAEDLYRMFLSEYKKASSDFFVNSLSSKSNSLIEKKAESGYSDSGLWTITLPSVDELLLKVQKMHQPTVEVSKVSNYLSLPPVTHKSFFSSVSLSENPSTTVPSAEEEKSQESLLPQDFSTQIYQEEFSTSLRDWSYRERRASSIFTPSRTESSPHHFEAKKSTRQQIPTTLDVNPDTAISFYRPSRNVSAALEEQEEDIHYDLALKTHQVLNENYIHSSHGIFSPSNSFDEEFLIENEREIPSSSSKIRIPVFNTFD
eukprot:GDKJ01009160.1.p1 GENE.GDKJ01009160.1~~GDKJ01009160.1.p1  ORF type:complete len:555 (+),score=115.20 GDKJ01009160.1:170-1666(+)